MQKPRVKARIRREMSNEKPTIQIGKSGVTGQLLKEVLNQLNRNEIVKMKMLKTALKDESVEGVIQKIVADTDSILIDRRGHVFVLYKPRKRKKPL